MFNILQLVWSSFVSGETGCCGRLYASRGCHPAPLPQPYISLPRWQSVVFAGRRGYRRTDGQTDGQTDGGTDGRTDGQTDRRTDGQTDRRTDGQTDGRTGQTDGQRDGRIDRQTDVRTGQTDGQRDGRTDGQTDGRTGQTDGRTDGRTGCRGEGGGGVTPWWAYASFIYDPVRFTEFRGIKPPPSEAVKITPGLLSLYL